MKTYNIILKSGKEITVSTDKGRSYAVERAIQLKLMDKWDAFEVEQIIEVN